MLRSDNDSDDDSNSNCSSEKGGVITTRMLSRIIIIRRGIEGINLSVRHDRCVAFMLVVNITKHCVHDNIRKYCLYSTPIDLYGTGRMCKYFYSTVQRMNQ